MIALTPGIGRQGDPVGEREVGVAGHDRHPGPVAGPAQGHLDRDLAAGLGRADADRRRVAGQDDRVRADVADGPPGEEQVGQLLERRPPPGDHLELALVELERVLALDEQAAADPLEVEVGDAVVAQALRRVGRHGEQLEAGLLAQDPEGRLGEARRDHRLVRVGRDLPGGRAVELAVDARRSRRRPPPESVSRACR